MRTLFELGKNIHCRSGFIQDQAEGFHLFKKLKRDSPIRADWEFSSHDLRQFNLVELSIGVLRSSVGVQC